ncbi:MULTISPECIES: toprim domain-containing protein [Thalassospira]|uniref:Toprim domain-containing protein n=2 Tax=Thalassospira xiamenensis TaxID=220697 RepID=A0ABR5Y4Z9_9PROT|nr:MULTISPECIES: toprim domain-containing protein [Thalassospira]AJD52984.1 hypothetical protein TH3_14360 [Thalassospira xiamenensis M-5 = DSM 17429]KZD06130.1 hypothetical protein AUP40_11015 [Thalassospira xiamenensis]KZD07581.1 hypothetical protein AUP45_04125 [Thalassospira xiamenensis]MBC07745.1 DNA primase [Thalassospira sp.]SIT19878.1 Toprim domain-containing protein [Thalassospira xiamenensis M-5 = DSM 17429]
MQVGMLADALASQALAVCRCYLPSGRRQGQYWICGDVHGTPGRSLFVRISGYRAGKWCDAATGEYGDLLDLIMLNRGLSFRDALAEARHFLGMPCLPEPPVTVSQDSSDAYDPIAAARRLFAASVPITGTLAERYLGSRGMQLTQDHTALRFHPHCYYRNETGVEVWPALIAAVTDLKGMITGIHRTWLDPETCDKAPVDQPRRALGQLLGHAVHFGQLGDIAIAAEGLETALTLKMLFPNLPVLAALSAAHLGALILPDILQRLYVASDNDPAGWQAFNRLRSRHTDRDIRALVPRLDDFNADLITFGPDPVRQSIARQLLPEDVPRFVLCPQPTRSRHASGHGPA